MENLTIGKVAKAADVNVETIRFYERKGLVRQPATYDGSYRIYSRAVVSRIRFIQRAKQLGFGLDEVRKLLTLADRPNDKRVAAITIAEENLEDIKLRIKDIQDKRHTDIRPTSQKTSRTKDLQNKRPSGHKPTD